MENVKPVYELLTDLGMRTTKTAWMLQGEGAPIEGGSTCEDRDYRVWLQSLQRQGFEIALHNAAPCTSRREVTSLAFARFHELFGTENTLFSHHTSNGENIYWGKARISGWRGLLYDAVTMGTRRRISHGHVNGHPLFWGDMCQARVRYVRNFVFNDLDALAVCPEQPYHDLSKPYVNFWFTSADGGDLQRFLKNFSIEKLQRLEENRGLCIAYVHFAEGFVVDGKVHPEFRRRMEFLAGLNGWFAPASEVLEHLRNGATPRQRAISPETLAKLERKWLYTRLFHGPC